MSRIVHTFLVYLAVLGFVPVILLAWTGSETSGVFFVDTHVISGTSDAQISSSFELETRIPPGSVEAFSKTFSADTRYRGNSGSATSPGFGINTVQSTLDRVEITGCPTTLNAGANATLHATAFFANGNALDVSPNCVWSVTRSTGGVSFGDSQQNVLSVSPDAPAQTVFVDAQYRFPSGLRGSEKVQIQVCEAFRMSVASTYVTTYLTVPKPHAGYDFHADTRGPHGPALDANIRWDFDNDGDFNDGQGASASHMFLFGKTYLIGVKAVDAAAATNTVYFYLTVNAQSATEDALACKPAVDITSGNLLNPQGDPTTPDAARAHKGLVVLTHGLNNTGRQEWLSDMAYAVGNRVGGEGANLCIFDWGEMADPTRYNTAAARTMDGQSKALWLDDIIRIKPYGKAQGAVLANAIENWRMAGFVDLTKPLHLIGHSAGGFVMGECGTILRKLGYSNVQVTMLDTPQPYLEHAEQISQAYRVERYITQFGGTSGWDLPTLPDNLSQVASVSTALLGSDQYRVQPGEYYYRRVIGNERDYGWFDFHSEAHEWYTQTIRLPSTDDCGLPIPDGFNQSVALGWNGNFPQSAGISGASQAAASSGLQSLSVGQGTVHLSSSLPDIALSGFDSFGFVVESNGVYTLTEAGNAGIYKSVVLPIGIQSFKFRYKFTSPGDGDFLCVHWGDEPPLYIGLDLAISRDGFMDADVPLTAYAAQTNTLVVKLISRNATNAVAVLDSLAFSQSDDPDRDGLTTDQELAIGTNPLNPDCDGDGISDGYEVNILETNPLLRDSDGDGFPDRAELLAGTGPTDPDSCFAVTQLRFVAEGVELTWASCSGRTYRIHWRPSLAAPDSDTVASGVAGNDGVSTFIDAVDRGQPAGFYWVETE